MFGLLKFTAIATTATASALAYVPSNPEITYVIQEADLITGHAACAIAARCDVDISHLVLYNPTITSWRSVNTGQLLRLPSTAKCSPSAVSPPVTISQLSADPGMLFMKRQTSSTYTVVAGDTAWNIAENNHITLDILKAANPQVSDWELIQVGVVLNIPAGQETVQPPSGVVPDAASSQNASSSLCMPGETYTVVAGDTAFDIAQRHGITLPVLQMANPQVCNWEMIYPGLQLIIPNGNGSPQGPAGPPRPTGPPPGTPSSSPPPNSPGPPGSTTQVSGAFAVTNFNVDEGESNPENKYKFYQGDGSAGNGWPSRNQWISFNAMWDTVKPYIGTECIGNGATPNTDEETQQVREAILSVSAKSLIDPRFVLAVMMQESNGCVRVQSTANAVANPGLMQSYMGKGSCNSQAGVQSPCPQSTIELMVMDGVSNGEVNLVAGMNRANSIQGLGSCEIAQAYYRSARMYNSGPNSFPLGADLGQQGATECYVSDIANRLTGWTTDPRTCTLNQ